MGGPPLPGWLRIAMLHIIIELTSLVEKSLSITYFLQFLSDMA
jgi:hypothetical protein